MGYTNNLEAQLTPLAETASKLTYQLFQQSKLYFGVAHKTLASRLTHLFVTKSGRETQTLAPEILLEVQQRLNKILETDWEDAQRGIYPHSLLFANDWDSFFRRYPDLWLDLPEIWQRLNDKKYQEFDSTIDREGYPSYYLQNFHHQTNGYLSEQSAHLYDLQVDIIFNGAADAMRRRILAPLQQAIKSGFDLAPRQVKILDVACATGRTLQTLRTTFPQASLFGVDISPTYLRKANQVLSDNPGELPQLIQANAEELPYQDNYFHGVSSVFLFHELPGEARQNVINECFRVTKPGGIFVICDSIQVIDDPQFKPMLENFPILYHEPYYRDYISDDLTLRLQKAGFTNITIEHHFMSKYWIAHKIV